MALQRSAILVSLLLAFSVQAAKPVERLKVTLGTTTIEVAHAAGGGTVLLIGYERTARDYSRVFRRVERTSVADAHGDATFDIGRDIAPNSVWAAIDTTTGDYGATAPDIKRLRASELLPEDMKKDSGGNVATVIARFHQVYMLLVRPGLGVFELTSGDGGPFDGDQTMNGRIALDASRLVNRVPSGSGLDAFREGDLIVVFVPRQLGYLVARVTK